MISPQINRQSKYFMTVKTYFMTVKTNHSNNYWIYFVPVNLTNILMPSQVNYDVSCPLVKFQGILFIDRVATMLLTVCRSAIMYTDTLLCNQIVETNFVQFFYFAIVKKISMEI